MSLIIIGALIAILVLWGIGVQRKLVVMDENVNNAMSQIGVQLSSRFDALTALLDLTKGYAAHESQTLIETIKSRRSVITATSTPDDVLKQEGVISEALGRISMVAEQYPELKANENYKKCMNAVDSYEKMVRTSRLIYNDSVTKLNRELRMFPTSLLGGMFGFRQRDYLEMEGYEITAVDNGQAAITEALKGEYDLILLDLMLPGCNGYDVCRLIRDRIDIPILMVTARTESVDKVRGLGLGADDYIAKPFDPAELVARVKSHLARYARLTGGQEEQEALTVGDLRILPQSWKVFKGEREVKMPNREFALLKFLAEHPNVVFSKEKLFEAIWGCDYLGDSATVTVHIGRIRDKVEDDPAHPTLIETVWGAGYRLNRQ